MRVGVGWIVGVVLAAMWAGGLRAAIWWRDRQSAHWTEDTSADDAKRARLAELCARIPRLAPPASVVGADDVERLTGREVIALLRAGRLAELESLLEGAQNVVESDSSKEH